MKSGFRLGKIFGVNIDIDWSWLLIFALVSWSLASSFGLAHPGWTGLLQWGLALTAALLFFASILTHELAHALAASAMKVPVRNITLFIFGGISNIQREPRSPFDEFVIAIVGPLTSIVLGGVFLTLGLGRFAFDNILLMDSTSALSQIGPLGTMFMWLGSVNILIALFNMIPGFPLDGGRIVRSTLWAVTDDLRKATRWASWMGQAVAWILIFTGISMMFGVYIPILGTGFINGIWIMFIGWFLQTAAVQSYQRILVEDIPEDIPVKQMMYTDVPMVKAGISVQSLIDNYIMQTDHRAFVVFDGDRMVGMVTIDDVRKVEAEARSQTIIRSIMTPSKKLIVIAPEEDATAALQRLQSEDVRQLPVVAGDKIIGLLRRKDIVRWMQLKSHFG